MSTALGREMERLLEERRLSQRQLAKMAGVSRETISNAVRGKSVPRPDTLLLISRAYATGSNGRSDSDDLDAITGRLFRLAGYPRGDRQEAAIATALGRTDMDPEDRIDIVDAVDGFFILEPDVRTALRATVRAWADVVRASRLRKKAC
jgi:transcriptional regulator with XRE-family HTH domain